MLKRPLTESSCSDEADSSEISQPTTKIIRIVDEENPKSSFSDKCIQVDSETCADPNGEKPLSLSEEIQLSESIKGEVLLASSSSDTCTTTVCNSDQISTEDDNVKDDDSVFTYQQESEQSSLLSTNSTIEPSPYDLGASINIDRASATCSTEAHPLSDTKIKAKEVQVEGQDESSSSSASAVSANAFHDESAASSSSETDSKIRPLQGALKVPGRKPKIKRSVIFNGVTVYYFCRSQGFTCVPSQGGSTLGMENTHSYIQNFTLESHAEERKRAHREILLRQRRFAKLNKHSSTSESEEDSCDDLSDFSDIDLENDSCYFLQPVPIKQRRALLRASGVRKIETAEKEECRDIRLSREFCGCDCPVYCQPASCACHQAGIKCQVDRMSFPCGCTREGCSNTNGRIEFNPLRVRTHFIHTLMKIEMEKKQIQQEQERQSSSNVHLTDGFCAGTSNYNPPMSAQCNPNLPTPELYMPMQNNHYVSEGTHLLMPGSSNNFTGSTCANIFTNDYSPDNSSYSENSDYTSDDFEEELGEKNEGTKQREMFAHQSNYISNSQNTRHVISSIPQVSSIGSTNTSSSNVLPPFPSINSSCDISSSNYKNNHCHPYQESSMHLNAYAGPYSALADSTPSQHASVYSYDIHSSSHYSYPDGFHKDNFASVSTSHQSAESSSNEQMSTPQLVTHSNTAQQQYIDLSLSIASSSSAESLLSAANTSDEDSRLTPISFTHIQPLSSSSSFYPHNDSSTNPCDGTFEQSYPPPKSAMPACQVQYIESNEASRKSESVENLSNENFGEIIKKSIVESVSA